MGLESSQKQNKDSSDENLSRREFMKGAVTGIAAMSVPSGLEASENENDWRSVPFSESFEYDTERIRSLLESEREIQELSDSDLIELSKLAQSMFQNLFFDTSLQEQIRKKFGTQDTPEEVEIVIPTDDVRFDGLFSHGEGLDSNKIYLNKELTVPNAVNILMHEMMHGALGVDEVRVQFYSVLSQIAMYAQGTVPHPELILKNNSVLSLWDNEDREIRKHGLYEVEYTIMPMTAVIMTADYINADLQNVGNASDSASILTAFTKVMLFSEKETRDEMDSLSAELLFPDGQFDGEGFIEKFIQASEDVLHFINSDSQRPDSL